MEGKVKTLKEQGFGFITIEGFRRDLFFHSNSLTGTLWEELKLGDSLSFEIELISRNGAPIEIVRRDQPLLLPYGEQKIVAPSSPAAIQSQKKLTADLIVRLSQTPTDLYQLSASDFEELIAELFRIDGYTVELLGSWNEADGGVDILAVKRDIGSNQFRTAIQCKRYSRGKRVSAAPIRALAGVLDRYKAHAGVFVTTSDFTSPAKEEVASYFWKLSLMNFHNVVDMLRRAELLVGRPISFSSIRSEPVEAMELYMCARNVQRV